MFGLVEDALRNRDLRGFERNLNGILFPDLLVFDDRVRNEFHRRVIAPTVYLYHFFGDRAFAPGALRALAAYILETCDRIIGDALRAELWAISRFRVFRNAFHPETYVRERPFLI